MNKIAKFQRNFCCSFSRVSRYGLTGLMVVFLLSDAVGAKVGNSHNYLPKLSPEILLDKYRDNFLSLADGDKQVLLRGYKNQQQIYIAQQPESTPSIPLNAEQQKLYQQGVKLVEEGQELEKKVNKESYEQAINKYQKALEIAQKLGLLREEVEILVYIGGAYSSISEEQTTLDYLEQALKKSQQLKPSYKAGILGYIGSVYINIGRLDDALSHLKKAQSIFLEQNKLEPDELGLLASSYKSMAIVYHKKGELEKALISLEEALKIYRDTLKSPAGQADVLEDIGFIHSLRGETSKAFEKYNQVLAILEKGNDLPAQAEILERIASLHSKLGKYQQALKDLYKALKLLQQKEGTSIQQGTTITRIADVYGSLGDYQTAIQYYQGARDIYLKAGDTYLGALTSITIASIYTSFIGDSQKALDYLDNALTFKADNKELLAWIMKEKADIYVSQSDYQNAFNEYSKVLEIQHSIQNLKSEAMTFKKLALLYKLLGDYEESIHNFNKALNIYKQMKDKPQQAITLGFIGSIYETVGKYDESLNSYERALSLLNKESYQSEILTLQGMVRTYNSLKNYPKALETAEKALALSKDKGKYEETRSLHVLANIFFSKGDYEQALENYQKVLESFQQLGLLLEEADAWSNIGMTYTLSKQYQKAINTFNKELKLRRTLKNGTDEADALYNIAINQRNLGNLEAALPNIKAAINIVENIRGNVQSDELRTSYFATVQNYYKFYIDLLMQLHKKDPSKGYNAQALHISERSRARVLVELLKAGNVNLRKDVEPQLLAEESRLQNKLKVKETLLSNLLSQKGSSTELINKTNQEITNILQESQNLTAKIRAKNPERAELTNPEDILQLPGIQQQLDKDTILLQYSLGKERSYLWVVTPNSLESYELPGQEKIAKAAKDFYSRLTQPLIAGGTPEDNSQVFADTEKAANSLSELILKPVAGKLGNKRLVIVADGILHQVPFAALNEPKKSPISNEYQPLIVKHEIVNLPSISSLATHRKKLKTRNIAPKTLAVLANPVFSADDTRLKNDQPSSVETNLDRSALETSLRNIKQGDLKPLPGTKDEGEAILKLVNSPNEKLSAFDFDANYNFATSKQLRQYRYLQFATHGIFDSVNPALSGIVLSLVNKQGKPQARSFLRLNDIFNLDLPAELIVLSACQSGLAENVQGEGLVGLTRGFMYAGAARVTVSLWNVNDQSTKELMIAFYKQMLEQKKSPAAALNVAQRQMWLRKDLQNPAWKHPRYWAAFTLQGEWR